MNLFTFFDSWAHICESSSLAIPSTHILILLMNSFLYHDLNETFFLLHAHKYTFIQSNLLCKDIHYSIIQLRPFIRSVIWAFTYVIFPCYIDNKQLFQIHNTVHYRIWFVLMNRRCIIVLTKINIERTVF